MPLDYTCSYLHHTKIAQPSLFHCIRNSKTILCFFVTSRAIYVMPFIYWKKCLGDPSKKYFLKKPEIYLICFVFQQQLKSVEILEKYWKMTELCHNNLSPIFTGFYGITRFSIFCQNFNGFESPVEIRRKRCTSFFSFFSPLHFFNI